MLAYTSYIVFVALAFACGVRAQKPFQWSRIEAAGAQPSQREGHAAVEVGQRIYIIGGCMQGIRCYSDVHMFDTDSLTWNQIPVTGDIPDPRGGHTATLLGTDIYVYGGASTDATYGDVYKLDLVQQHWTRAVFPKASPNPGHRTNHGAAADANGRVYIFGGYDDQGNFLNDIWVMNAYEAKPLVWHETGSFPADWSHLLPSGQPPKPRESHSLTLVDRRLVVFGGYTAEGVATNDVHVFDIDDQKWTALPMYGDVPSPRQAHAAARHGHDIIVVGGCQVYERKPTCYNDVWVLSVADMRWTQRASDLVTWFPREGHSASFVRSKLFVFGGCQLYSECYNDMALVETFDPCPAKCGGHGVCSLQQFCRCWAGFTGHDCMQPLSCPEDQDCGAASGSVEALSSGGHGSRSMPQGQPKLQQAAGFSLAISKAHVGQNDTKYEAAGLSLAASKAHVGPDDTEYEAPPVDQEDFGVEHLNEHGHTGINMGSCGNNCNFRGVCVDGECYCQPGFYGHLCDVLDTSSRGRLPIETTSLVLGVALVVGFALTYLLLRLNHTNSVSKERVLLSDA